MGSKLWVMDCREQWARAVAVQTGEHVDLVSTVPGQQTTFSLISGVTISMDCGVPKMAPSFLSPPAREVVVFCPGTVPTSWRLMLAKG
ncbi:MAG: hypothetical protein ACI8UD_000467 [Planctomycetota bacterium]|jgi:hypothetical protein